MGYMLTLDVGQLAVLGQLVGQLVGQLGFQQWGLLVLGPVHPPHSHE